YGTSAYRLEESQIDVPAKRYRYTGMERDEETGLGYHTARYYVPWLGRWTAADPIGIADGANRYSYVGGRPISSTDISGLAEGRLAQPLTAFAQKLAGEKISDGINGFFNPPDDGGGGDVADVDDGAGDGEVEAITNNDPSRPATPKNTAFVQELRERD